MKVCIARQSLISLRGLLDNPQLLRQAVRHSWIVINNNVWAYGRDITIVKGDYKSANTTGGHHPVVKKGNPVAKNKLTLASDFHLAYFIAFGKPAGHRVVAPREFDVHSRWKPAREAE